MGRGIVSGILSRFDAAAKQLHDYRKGGNALFYEVSDAAKSALAVFYFQHPSLLNFQQQMQWKHKRNNLKTLFGVKAIPGQDELRNLVDNMDPQVFAPVFWYGLKKAIAQGIIDRYRVLDGGVLIPWDGTWYFSSKKIHCDHCLTMTHENKKGEKTTTYYHDMLCLVIAMPGCPVVIPLMPEFIRNEDGMEKQDCERNAAKRKFEADWEKLTPLKPTFLGDDLYACYPICKMILDKGMSFIFTCKPSSHPWITEQVKNSYPEKRSCRKWNGREHLIYRYKWVNGVEIRSEGTPFPVNYFELQIWNVEKKEITFKNSWITNKTVNKDNVKHLCECARTRWKIENENNNVLKHRGYNLEHNFGHGKNHAAEVFCLLNLLSFLIHSLQDFSDEDYKKARAAYGRRDEFFSALRYEMSHYPHDNWHDFLITIAEGLP
jgi:hypothetical protein